MMTAKTEKSPLTPAELEDKRRRAAIRRRDIFNSKLPTVVFLAPFLILFCIFTVIPIVTSVFLSFSYFNMLEAPSFIGFENYIRMFFDDDVFLIALRNTMVFAFVTGPIGYVLSFVFAWLINEFGRGLRTLLTVIFYGPSLAGNVYFIWTYIFSGDSVGFLNSLLMRMGFLKDPIQWLTDPNYNMGVVIVVVLWLSMGAGFLAFVAGLQSMDKSLYEAASIDGIRNRFQELWYITLPQMVPQLLFGAVMTISTSFAVGYECMNLTGFPSTDYSTHTLVLHIMDFGSIRFEMGYASAVAVILFGVMLIFWTIVNKVLSKWGE